MGSSAFAINGRFSSDLRARFEPLGHVKQVGGPCESDVEISELHDLSFSKDHCTWHLAILPDYRPSLKFCALRCAFNVYQVLKICASKMVNFADSASAGLDGYLPF